MSIAMGASATKGKGSSKAEKHCKTWAAQLNLHPVSPANCVAEQSVRCATKDQVTALCLGLRRTS